MTKITEEITETIAVVFGNDHALGPFMDVKDQRYADSGKDEQGEGFVFEWNQKFKIMQNKIELDLNLFETLSESKGRDYIIECCDAFIKNNELPL